MTPERRSQLLAFLRRLDLDPTSEAGAQSETCRRRLALVDEALTHTSAGLRRNHEALEFLGDAVLRLAAAAFLQREHPRLSVGRCSSLRAQLVSDRWLAELAAQLELEAVLQLGAVAAGDQAARATVRAECCEALVGAVYEGWGGAEGGLKAVHHWLDPHWRQASAALLADPLRHNWKSGLQEWSQGQRLGPRHWGLARSMAASAAPSRIWEAAMETAAAPAAPRAHQNAACWKRCLPMDKAISITSGPV